GVYVVVVSLHVGVVAGNILKRAPPEIVPVGQHVGLGHQRQHFALGIISLARVFERPADAALAALAGVDRRLRGNFVGRVLLQKATHAAVEILGVFANYDKIDVLGLFAGQRRFDAWE